MREHQPGPRACSRKLRSCVGGGGRRRCDMNSRDLQHLTVLSSRVHGGGEFRFHHDGSCLSRKPQGLTY